jgi:hypothetical protein
MCCVINYINLSLIGVCVCINSTNVEINTDVEKKRTLWYTAIHDKTTVWQLLKWQKTFSASTEREGSLSCLEKSSTGVLKQAEFTQTCDILFL